MRTLFTPIAAFLFLSAAFASEPDPSAASDEGPRTAAAQTLRDARALQADPAFSDYAGWLDYLASQLEQKMEEEETLSAGTKHVTSELAAWIARIKEDPETLAKLRGRNEWAYLSKVDGTGQPFTIVIPEDYDPARSYPLHISLHGRGSNHHRLPADAGGENSLHLSIMGRSPTSGYFALGEVDILEALDYVTARWNIDRDRIHLQGHSMGGFGTFSIASRHPDLFASARPKAGGVVELPLENLLHVPFYALHGLDDPAVPPSMSRAGTRFIEAIGGRAIQDEAERVGHGVSKEGEIRSRAWADRLARPTRVSRIHYTATDELARRAYWIEIAEWGPEGRPASMDARLDLSNTLYLTLDNVAAARINLSESPADLGQTMHVVINRTIAATLEPPLPEALHVVREGDSWRVSPGVPPAAAFRLHFPGGATALYHGEPIMIVWGTSADEGTNKAILTAAKVARRSTSPAWPKPGRILGGIADNYTTFGRLPGKPDAGVTKADIEKYNLLLIGTPAQNSLVARIADLLPVKIKEGRVVTSGGLSWDFTGRALGLLYYNPLAPARLIYWAASDSPEFYAPDAPLMRFQNTTAPPDFLLMSATTDQRVAARRFDSRWNWQKGYTDSPLLPESFCSPAGHSAAISQIIRAETAADFALLGGGARPAEELIFSPGETRKADALAFEYMTPLALMDLTGRELLRAMESFKPEEEKTAPDLRFLPAPRPENIAPEKLYRIVMPPWIIWDFPKAAHIDPPSYRITQTTFYQAISRHLNPDANPPPSNEPQN